jgi:hypothetical protein
MKKVSGPQVVVTTEGSECPLRRFKRRSAARSQLVRRRPLAARSHARHADDAAARDRRVARQDALLDDGGHLPGQRRRRDPGNRMGGTAHTVCETRPRRAQARWGRRCLRTQPDPPELREAISPGS